MYVNTVGQQKSVGFFGGSRVVGPDGRTVAQAAVDREDCQIVEIDLSEAVLRRRRQLLFRDRRPELYGFLAEAAGTG